MAKVLSVNISEEKGTVKKPVSVICIDANGIAGDAHVGPWHRQVSLLAKESIDVSSLLQVGTNTVELCFPFRFDPNDAKSCFAIEAPIIAGDFAVRLDSRGRASLRAAPAGLSNVSLADQGYPYYAGRMLHQHDFFWPPILAKDSFFRYRPRRAL